MSVRNAGYRGSCKTSTAIDGAASSFRGVIASRPVAAEVLQEALETMPFGYSAPKRRRTSGSGQWGSGAGDSPASVSSGDSPEEGNDGRCAANKLSQTQLLASVRPGLKAQSAEDLALIISDRNPSRIPPSSPRLPRGTSCPGGKHIRGKKPHRCFFRRVAGRERQASRLSHCRCVASCSFQNIRKALRLENQPHLAELRGPLPEKNE